MDLPMALECEGRQGPSIVELLGWNLKETGWHSHLFIWSIFIMWCEGQTLSWFFFVGESQFEKYSPRALPRILWMGAVIRLFFLCARCYDFEVFVIIRELDAIESCQTYCIYLTNVTLCPVNFSFQLKVLEPVQIPFYDNNAAIPDEPATSSFIGPEP